MRRLCAAVMLLLLLAGCAALEEPDEMDWTAYQQDLPEEEPEEPPEETGPEAPTAFSLAYHKDRTLDPITCGGDIQQEVSALLYEPLFQLSRDFEPEPVLCADWSWDETGTVCTLLLREDAHFHDGTPVTARDAADALQRAMVSERYAYRLRNVTAAAAGRSGELVITLAQPDQGFLALLDIPIVKSGTETQLAPVGSGSYLFVTSGEGDFLRADPDWWQNKRRPVEIIPLVEAKDQATAMYLFSSRRIELLAVDPTDDLAAVAGQYETAHQGTTLLQFIGFNTRQGLFADAAARSAFSAGIPRETIASAQMAGLASAAQFPISPRAAIYPADLERPYDRDKTAAALRALAPAENTDAGAQEPSEEAEDTEGMEDAAPLPRTLTLLVNEEDAFRLTSARFIADSLSVTGGWQITLRSLPWEEYLAALEAGDFDLYFGEVRLTANWDLSDLIRTGGLLNYGGYTSPATDDVLSAFAAEADRAAAARRLVSHLQLEAPIAPVCFRNYTVLTHPAVVEGLVPAPAGTFYGMEDWTVHLKGN